MILPQVFSAIDIESSRFCTNWKIVCSDSERTVAFMEARGVAKSGARYDQRYCHVFAFRDGKIAEVWEFFDSCLAEAALFGDRHRGCEPEPENRFSF